MKEEALFGIYESSSGGFGFVKIEGYDDEVYIPKSKKADAMHGDAVRVRISKRAMADRKAEGEVVSIVERNTSVVVGTFCLAKKTGRKAQEAYGYVRPDNPHVMQKFMVSKERSKGAKDGQKVVLRITDYGDRKNHRKSEGIISEILGYASDPGVDVRVIARAYGLSDVFPAEVRREAKRSAVPVSDEMTKARLDLRDRIIFTIDGDDSKDFDDAVSLEKKDGRFLLGVHIADVTAYVKEKSFTDIEALCRGTSVYLPGLVVPMLPESLSNGICSLNPDEDRLTLSCFMTIDDKGKITDSVIAESVIHSTYRLTYSKVNAIIEDRDKSLCDEYADIAGILLDMHHLSEILKKKRHRRGSIDFDLPETKVLLDENGRTIGIEPYDRNAATSLIEEFMIAANETVAETFCAEQIPFIYRSHEDPDPEKIEKLNSFVNGFGYHLKLPGGKIHPKEIQKLLEKIGDSPEETLIERLTLRSLQQARYTVEPLGHFGLASTYYCHFTSPIRRYPDLQIHRIIKDHLHGKLNARRLAHYRKILDSVASESNRLERRAEETERECVKLKKTEYMQQFIGQRFKGIISSVTDWGIYVELDNTVEGMIPLRDLTDDYYIFDEDEYLVYGRLGGRVFRLGQSIDITVERADIQSREIDFLPAD